jgi:hypothetical protein
MVGDMHRHRAILLVFMIAMAGVLGWVINDVATEGDITPNDEFFELSIGAVPRIDEDAWSLRIEGHVMNSTTLTYQEILAMPSTEVRATLKCVEGPSGTAVWKGVPLRDVLDTVGVRDGAVDVVFHAADGYSSSLDLDDANEPDVLLCYGMNGEPLPEGQGFPLKVVVPGKSGYKWVKWIERIEVVDYDHKGFWESRGWDDEAEITTLADWAPHAILLTLAAILGGLTGLSGLRVSQETRFWRDLPEFFSRGLHSKASWLYFFILYSTFSYWVVTTWIRRGDVFYSSHGIVALSAVSLQTIGLVTGIALDRGHESVRRLHFVTIILGYLLLLGAITVGLIII